MARMSLRIRLGPLVYFEVDGDSCAELSGALEGFEELNEQVDAHVQRPRGAVYPVDHDGDGDEPRWPRRDEESLP